jgi:hypothetical protein
MSLAYSIFVVIHIISATVAVGSATIADYLHLVGLRKRSLERKLADIYPYVSRAINLSLAVIYLTGIVLVTLNPSLLKSSIFITKIVLVLIVTINGIYLQKSVSPHLDKCVLKGTKYCTPNVLYSSAISGSISIVTWYSILILSLTKNLGYALTQFLAAYITVLIATILIAYTVEKHSRKWRS